MLGNRSKEKWTRQYPTSHQNPVNRVCHTVGIPLILLSLLISPMVLWNVSLWKIPAGLFALGGLFQFAGHAFERKPPEFFKDWRFLFVGVRWWLAKISGRPS